MWDISSKHLSLFWGNYEEYVCTCSSRLQITTLHTFYLKFTNLIFCVLQSSRCCLVNVRSARGSCRKFYWLCWSYLVQFCFYCLLFYFRRVWSWICTTCVLMIYYRYFFLRVNLLWKIIFMILTNQYDRWWKYF